MGSHYACGFWPTPRLSSVLTLFLQHTGLLPPFVLFLFIWLGRVLCFVLIFVKSTLSWTFDISQITSSLSVQRGFLLISLFFLHFLLPALIHTAAHSILSACGPIRPASSHNNKDHCSREHGGTDFSSMDIFHFWYYLQISKSQGTCIGWSR